MVRKVLILPLLSTFYLLPALPIDEKLEALWHNEEQSVFTLQEVP